MFEPNILGREISAMEEKENAKQINKTKQRFEKQQTLMAIFFMVLI